MNETRHNELGSLVDVYLENLASRLGTQRVYRRHLKSALKKTEAITLEGILDIRILATWVASIQESGVGKASLAQAKAAMRSFLAWCLQDHPYGIWRPENSEFCH